ncbi:MAG: O-antigen ligase family protein, partial [Anaerolineales bacterium]
PFLGLGLFVLTCLCRWVAQGRLSLLTGLEMPIALLLLMALVGWGISVNPWTSWTRFWGLIAGLVTFYAVANHLASSGRSWQVVAGVAGLTLAIAAFCLVGVDWRNPRLLDPWGLYPRLPILIGGLPHSGVGAARGLVNPRWIGMAMGLLLPVSLPTLVFGRDRLLRWLAAAAVLAGLLALALSQSIQGLAGLLAGVFFLLLWRSRWYALLVPLGLLLLLAVVLVLGPGNLAASLLTLNTWLGKGAVLRIDMQSRALAMLADMPYTGIGLNVFPFIQSHFYPGYLIGPEPTAHDLYFQTALDFGLPGLFAFLWLVGGWGYSVWRNYRAAADPGYRLLLVGLAAGVLAYLAHGFFDALMLGSKAGPPFWAILGAGAVPPVAAASDEEGFRESSRRNFLTRTYPFQALTLVLVVALSALFNPMGVVLNLAGVEAHTGVYQARISGVVPVGLLTRAATHLRIVLSKDPLRALAYDHLASAGAWTGDYDQAVTALYRRIALDGASPYRTYYPPEDWLRTLNSQESQPGGNWDDLLLIYSQWMHRYPAIAENYVRVALVWERYKANPAQALKILHAGLDQEAQPQGLLEYYLAQLEPNSP